MAAGRVLDPAAGVRPTGDVEVKWGVHAPGETRAGWTVGDQRTTMVLLVDGTFRVDLNKASAPWRGRVTISSGPGP
jgi:hypothetical protein